MIYKNIYTYNLISIVAMFLFNSCNKNDTLFNQLDVKKTGVDFINKLTDTPDLNVLTYLYYYNGAGVTVGDYNNDGLEDIYLVANQGMNKLYLNKGDLKFEDVTVGDIVDEQGWSTGVTSIDINNDGLLDIYLCKVGKFKNLIGKNKLFVNQGVSVNGVPTFKDEANAYGLDISSFSTQAVFFDYDLDNDLDMFLLNHSVYPNRTYGQGHLRTKVDSLSGDRLFRNDDGKFTDVSYESKIYQGRIGYGLGITTSDINNDGYPDLYISNDFFENDYLYINQQDGTFKDIISNNERNLGHTSHFSMGNDIADFNNDGLTDIISLDMLPENIETYKVSGMESPYQNYNQYLKNGYAPQYMQNMLQLNLGNGNFSEIAFNSGIAATEWSWSSLFADFDNDGFKDLYITNGIVGVTNDMDFISFIANENIQKRISQGMTKEDLALIDELPKKKIRNYIFKNNRDLTFSNVSKSWLDNEPTFSNGAAYVDLDNDGDLDLITNNVNDYVDIHENRANESKIPNNYIKIKFKGNNKNNFGIGTKVKIYTDSLNILQENYVTRGYLSSVSPNLTIGLGKSQKIDSMIIIWPKGNYQVIKNIKVNQSLTIIEDGSKGNYYKENTSLKKEGCFQNSKLNIAYKHIDNSFVEFNRDPLIPYMNCYQGPDVSVSDVNGDGLEDLFLSGAKGVSSKLYLQESEGNFILVENTPFHEDNLSEDVKHMFLDVDNDNDKDLIVISGGNEFKKGAPLQPRLYINSNGVFKLKSNAFGNVELNGSVIVADDIDNDGDSDLFIGSNSVPWQFGITPVNYIFNNDGHGNFMPIPLEDLGLVQDAVFVDINKDYRKDLVCVGYWMPITILNNTDKGFVKSKNESLTFTNGLWNCLKIEDFDNDGDVDLLVGNWGLNTRLNASKDNPINLYLNDYDNNGTIDPVISYHYNGVETPFSTKEELTKHFPFINKKYLSYKDFSKAEFKDIFDKTKLANANKKHIYTLATSYFENDGNNSFKVKEIPKLVQSSSVHTMYIEDFDNNGFKDILLAGNRYDLNTQLGRLDASHGQLLMNYKGDFVLDNASHFSIDGPARSIKKINVKNEEYLVVGINNDSLQVLKKSIK
jgi:hypothetical protein